MQKNVELNLCSDTLSVMNIGKLVRRNLSKPLEQRISIYEIQRRIASGVVRSRSNSIVILTQIHRELEAVFEDRAKAELAMSRVKRYV